MKHMSYYWNHKSLLKQRQPKLFIHQSKMTDHTALIERKYTGNTLKMYTLFPVEMKEHVILQWKFPANTFSAHPWAFTGKTAVYFYFHHSKTQIKHQTQLIWGSESKLQVAVQTNAGITDQHYMIYLFISVAKVCWICGILVCLHPYLDFGLFCIECCAALCPLPSRLWDITEAPGLETPQRSST